MSDLKEQLAPASVAILHKVRPDDIKCAPWNPVSRTEQRRLNRLQESIEDIGLIYPLAVTHAMDLIDGHRRLAVVKILKWETVPVLIVNSEFEHAYGSIQENQMRLSGNDLLGVYLANPNALLRRQKQKVSRVEEKCGKEVVNLLYRSGLTAGTFDMAMRVNRYIDGAYGPSRIVKWLVKHNLGGVIRHILDAGIEEHVISNAIKDDKPLKVRLTAQE